MRHYLLKQNKLLYNKSRPDIKYRTVFSNHTIVTRFTAGHVFRQSYFQPNVLPTNRTYYHLSVKTLRVQRTPLMSGESLLYIKSVIITQNAAFTNVNGILKITRQESSPSTFGLIAS